VRSEPAARCRRCGAAQSPRGAHLRWPLVAILYGVALVLAYILTGSLLGELVEGMQRSRLPWWKLGLPLAMLAVALATGLLSFRTGVCDACRSTTLGWLLRTTALGPSARTGPGETRRAFLRGIAAAAAAGAGAAAAVLLRNRAWFPVATRVFLTPAETSAAHARPEWQDARVRGYRRLGRTNALVSDISLGSSRIDDVNVARRALERGINYFDTSPDYANTESERVLGEAVKGRRDQVFLATKFCAADGHLADDTPVPTIIEAVESSLARLQTDYVDLIHIHSCNRVERLLAPNIHEAFDRLKQQGKARFLGVSSHAPNLERVADAAIDSGRFDVMMLAYHFGIWPHFQTLLQRAAAHDLGIVAMKTLKGAKHTTLASFQDAAGAYSQAAFRWVLSNPSVSCLVVSISTHAQIDEYLSASGTALRDTDVALLQRYDREIAGDYCRPHCGACLGSCSYGLPIDDILRYRMYAKDYGWPEEGERHYAKLGRAAALCLGCAAPCAGSCPFGVPIQDAMLDAHRVLTS
jgi:aryl-alcohol dehydrogenase-like predicted oxidoreductase